MNNKPKQDDSEERTKLSLDLSDLDSVPASEIEPKKLIAVSEAAGFSKREAAPKIDSPPPGAKPTKPIVKQRKRRTTGRTYPFNTKIKPEAYEQLVNLSDQLSEDEGRPVSMAEVLERALICYEIDQRRRGNARKEG